MSMRILHAGGQHSLKYYVSELVFVLIVNSQISLGSDKVYSFDNAAVFLGFLIILLLYESIQQYWLDQFIKVRPFHLGKRDN